MNRKTLTAALLAALLAVLACCARQELALIRAAARIRQM